MPDRDGEIPLKMAFSYLAIAAYLRGELSLVVSLKELAEYADREGGQEKFAELFLRAEARREPGRSDTREAIRARARELMKQTE